MTITALPPAPQPSDTTEDFNSKAFTFVGALPTFVTETNAVAADVDVAFIKVSDFGKKYLGSKAANPTLDNEGAALQVGMLYWNSVASEMRAYSGTVWLTAYVYDADLETWATKTPPSGAAVGTTDTQTLTNKTLTTPVLSSVASGITDGRLGYSSGEVSFGNGTEQFTLGFKNIPQNSRSAAYTLVLTDAGKHIFHPTSDTTARTFTIPANSSVAYPIGTAITFINQNGAGIVTISITTDTMRLAVSGATGSRTLLPNGVATAVKVTATEWIISGTNLS